MIDELDQAFDLYFRTIAQLRREAEWWHYDTGDYQPIKMTDELSHLGQRLWFICRELLPE